MEAPARIPPHDVTAGTGAAGQAQPVRQSPVPVLSREAAKIRNLLLKAPTNFSFVQAMRLLGIFSSRRAKEADVEFEKRVSLRPWLSLAFPSTEVASLEQLLPGPDPRHPNSPEWQMTVTVFGLYSSLGPLPSFYTDELIEEARSDSSLSRDFLDVINNHLLHLYLEAVRHNNIERRTIETRDSLAKKIQHYLCGFVTPELQPAGLPYAALIEFLVSGFRSAAGLELYLRIVLGRQKIYVEQCVERTTVIPPADRCHLGRACCRLGDDATIGSTLRDSTSKFRIHIYDVDSKDFISFMPGGEDRRLLINSMGRYLYGVLLYDVLLHPSAAPAPKKTLGGQMAFGVHLGIPGDLSSACPCAPVHCDLPEQFLVSQQDRVKQAGTFVS